jgi:asparagine synthase (glutamine-hydrolysing)
VKEGEAMCGIVAAASFTRPLAVGRLKPMVDALAHRGPDDSGFLVWSTARGDGVAFNEARFRDVAPRLPTIDSPKGQALLGERPRDVFLGHRRLAILDPSPRGHQPMSAPDGEHWLVLNGEIYNYRELRAELERGGRRFVSGTDTEVLLHAYAEWGESAVERLDGMFAFALWDADREVLWLARDRYGVKPLYCRRVGDAVLFASEVKALLAYRPGAPRLDLLALNAYFSFQNGLDDRTLFDGVRMVPAGSHVLVDVRRGTIRAARYWDFDFSREPDLPAAEREERLRHLLRAAVRRQCVSDVPVGCYLSGGLDSGAVASAAAGVLGRMHTFTAGFDLSGVAGPEAAFDERAAAARMAGLLGTAHHECVVRAGDMEAVLAELVWRLEDLRVGQCYPNYYVAALAGRHVKVALSGAGGDELFGGYPWRYDAALRGDGDEGLYRYWQRLVPDEDKGRFFTPELARAFRDRAGCDFHEHTRAVFDGVLAGQPSPTTASDRVNRAMYFECKTFLHGLLAVEDKVSMAFGLETRVPFLDNELVDFACATPARCKVAGDTGKVVLRAALRRALPAGWAEARKQGFSAPDETWFRGPSAAYLRELLLGPASRLRALVRPEYVAGALDEHLGRRANRRLLLWSLVCFEWWLRAFQK